MKTARGTRCAGWFLAVAAAAALTGGLSAPTAAQTGMSVGVAPSLVEFEPSWDGALTEPLVVYNDGTVPTRVSAAILDAHLDRRGKLVFDERPQGQAKWSAAAWLELSREGPIMIPPGEEVEVQLTANPPEGAEPGTHRAVITFSAVDETASPEATVVPRLTVATLVLVEVPGEVRRRPVLDMRAPLVALAGPRIRLALHNEGNVHYFAKGSVRITGRGGKQLFERDVKTPQRGALVLPGGSRDLEVRWRDAPLVGIFEAVAEMRADEEPVTARRRLIVVRWQVLALPVAVGCLAALARALSKRYAIVKREADTGADGRRETA